MKKVLFGTILTLFTLLYQNVYSQSIPSFWLNFYKLEDYYKVRKQSVERITVKATQFYASGDSYKIKWVYRFIDKNHIEGEFFKDGVIHSKFLYEFDNQGQRVKNVIYSKEPLLGWKRRTYVYENLNGQRVSTKHYDGNGRLLRVIKFQYDNLKRLTKISIADSSGVLLSYETAVYEGSEYLYKVYRGDGSLILEDSRYCNMDVAGFEENEFGDCTRVTWPTSPDGRTSHHLEYQYDDFDNWIKMSHNIVRPNAKRSKHSIVKRKIKYIK